MKNELFYSLNDYFEVELNDNMPEIEGVVGYVAMPEGDLRFYSLADNDKGCCFHEKENGSVIVNLYNDKGSSVMYLESEGSDYVNDVNRIVSEWFNN